MRHLRQSMWFAALWLYSCKAAEAPAPKRAAIPEVSAKGFLQLQAAHAARLTTTRVQRLQLTTAASLAGESPGASNAAMHTAAAALQLHGFGRVVFAPNAAYAVRSPFAGYVQSVQVQAGDWVRPQMALATLHSADLAQRRAALQSSNSALQTAQDALQRSTRLVAAGAAAPRDLVEIRGQIKALQAEMTGMRQALQAAGVGLYGGALLTLRARRAGEVLVRQLEPGEHVAEGAAEAFLIGDRHAWQVQAHFPEHQAAWLVPGAACSVQVPALGETRYHGVVRHVAGVVQESSRTILLRCSVEAAPAGTAGMLAQVWVMPRHAAMLVVPRTALLLRHDAAVVLVRHQPASPQTTLTELERRPVQVGKHLGSYVEIHAGLQEGEDVVSSEALLFDGALDQLL